MSVAPITRAVAGDVYKGNRGAGRARAGNGMLAQARAAPPCHKTVTFNGGKTI